MIIRKADKRLWEIDVLRGIAVIIMIYFHFLYNLNHFSIIQYQLYTGFYLYLAYGTASIFVLLVGISLTLSYNRTKLKFSSSHLLLKYMKRGVMIFSLGLIITLITFLYVPEKFVKFGILHCIGISIILSIPLIRYRLFNGCLGVLIICIGIYLHMFTFDFPWLLPFGFIPRQFYTIDYFPLLPWFGVVLLGIAFGNIAYRDGKRRFALKDRSHSLFVNILCFLGRNSLFIYFLHQPLLIGLIYLFFL